MCVCVSQNTHDSSPGCFQSCRLMKSTNVFEKEKKDRVPCLRQSQDQRMGRKHLAVNRQQTSLRATKVLSTAKTNGYKKSKNVNANRIRVKSSLLK